MKEDNKCSGSGVKLIYWDTDPFLFHEVTLLDECLGEDLVIMVPSMSVNESPFHISLLLYQILTLEQTNQTESLKPKFLSTVIIDQAIGRSSFILL